MIYIIKMDIVKIQKVENEIKELQKELKKLKPQDKIFDNKKICSKCKITKNVYCYRLKGKCYGDKIRADCMDCQDKRNFTYYRKNKEKGSVLCDCGETVIGSYHKTHSKTKKCQKKILKLQIEKGERDIQEATKELKLQIEETEKKHIIETEKANEKPVNKNDEDVKQYKKSI